MRSLEFEHDFFAHACRGATGQAVPLTELAEARLAEGQRFYHHDQSLRLSLDDLAGMVEGKAVDTACWSVIFAQADEMVDLEEDKRLGVMHLLDSITAYAAMQAYLVRELRQTLAR